MLVECSDGSMQWVACTLEPGSASCHSLLPHPAILGDKSSFPPCNTGWQVSTAPTPALQVGKLRQQRLAHRNALPSTAFRLTLSNQPRRACVRSAPSQDELSRTLIPAACCKCSRNLLPSPARSQGFDLPVSFLGL